MSRRVQNNIHLYICFVFSVPWLTVVLAVVFMPSSRWLMSRRSWRSSGSSGRHFLRPSVRRSMWRLQKALRTTAGMDTTRAGKTSAIKLLHSCGCEDSLHNRSRHSLHIYFVIWQTEHSSYEEDLEMLFSMISLFVCF